MAKAWRLAIPPSVRAPACPGPLDSDIESGLEQQPSGLGPAGNPSLAADGSPVADSPLCGSGDSVGRRRLGLVRYEAFDMLGNLSAPAPPSARTPPPPPLAVQGGPFSPAVGRARGGGVSVPRLAGARGGSRGAGNAGPRGGRVVTAARRRVISIQANMQALL